MMEMVIEALSWVCLAGGSLFVFIGTLGVLRFPDVYTRMHAAGITDTLGAALILFGMMIQAGLGLLSIKLFMMLIFILCTSPVATHALARSAITDGLKPQLDKDETGEHS